MRLTIAVPAQYIIDANHFAMVLGYSEADGNTYKNPSLKDTQGNLYAAASLDVSDGFVAASESILIRPEWDTEEIIDMTKAAQAQSLVFLWQDNGTVAPTCNPSQITAILGLEGRTAIDAMGLQSIPMEI